MVNKVIECQGLHRHFSRIELLVAFPVVVMQCVMHSERGGQRAVVAAEGQHAAIKLTHYLHEQAVWRHEDHVREPCEDYDDDDDDYYDNEVF